ncbi:hypothetical protein M569_01540, partial [Genlisea aurea]
MQRFHAGSCNSAVKNSAHPGLQSRDTSRPEPSTLPSSYSLNSRQSSQLAAYKLKCDKDQLNARLGPPDFHPQTPNCPEETLTKEYVQSGYKDTVEGFEETREIPLSQIQQFTKPLIVKCKEAIRKCHRAINESRSQKRKAGQIYGVPLSGSLLNKPGVFPEQKPCGEEFRKKWIEGLSQSHKRLRSLADHVPHGYKKKFLFEVLIRDRVPLLRATWFIKVIYLNQARSASFNSSSALHDKFQVLCSEQWTKDAIEYFQQLLDEFLSRNHPHLNVHVRDRSPQVSFSGTAQQKGTLSSSVMDGDKHSLYNKWWYVVRIVNWHHSEGLVVPSLIIDWVLNQLQEKDLFSVLQLLLPVIYGFVEAVVSSQTYVRKLVSLAVRFIREPSPGGSDLVENSRRAYATSAVLEMFRFLILAVPDTFVALECFPVLPNEGNFLAKVMEDTRKVNYGQVEVSGLRDRNHEVQDELFSFRSVVSSIQSRVDTLSRASKPDYPGHNVAKTVQMLDQAMLSGEISLLYNTLFETSWDGICAERWNAEVSPCLLASCKHSGKISSSLVCSIFFVCEWATCEYRDFRGEPSRGLKFTGRKDVSQIFLAVRLLKQKAATFSSHERKFKKNSDFFDSPSPLHDAIVCWIDQHEVHNSEGFKSVQLLVIELIKSGVFNPFAYGRQLIVSGIDGNGSLVELEKYKRHYRLMKQLPASYIYEIFDRSQIADLSTLVEASNVYSNERRLVLHGSIGPCKSTLGTRSNSKRQKYQWGFQAAANLTSADVDRDTKIEVIKASVSLLLQFPPNLSSAIENGVDESFGFSKRPGGAHNRVSCDEDVSAFEECRKIKRQKISEEHRLNPIEEEIWWVKKEMKYTDSFNKVETPPKPLKQMPRSRQKSGRKTQSLAQLAAARIEGSQGASTSHACGGRIDCEHDRSSSDEINKLVDGRSKNPVGDIVSIVRLLKKMQFSDKRKLMVWLVSVTKQLIEESEKGTTKISRSAPSADDLSSRHWRLGDDELSSILYMMDVCNECVLASRFLFWLLPKVPGSAMLSRTTDHYTFDVGEAFLLSSIRSYENIIVAADLIPEMLSAMMQRIGVLLSAKGRISGSATLACARYFLKKYSTAASVVDWEKTFKSTCDKRLVSEIETGRSFEGDYGFSLGVPNGVEDLDDYFRQKINSVRASRVGMSMKEIVHRHVDEVFQSFFSKDRKAFGSESGTEKWNDVARQIISGLMECMRNTGGAAQEGDPSLVSSAIAAIINNLSLFISRIPDSGSLQCACLVLRIHIACLCILKDALGERQGRVFEVGLATEASSTLLQALSSVKVPRSQFHDAGNANPLNESHSNKNLLHSRSSRIFASVSALVIGCILQGVASLDRMISLFRLKDGLDPVQFIRGSKSNANGNARSMGVSKVDNALEVSLNWFRVLVGNCRTVCDGFIAELLGEASIASLSRMQRSLPLKSIFQPAYCAFAFITWKSILDVLVVGSREDLSRFHKSVAVAVSDAVRHRPFREICFRDCHGLYDLVASDTLDSEFVSLLESGSSDMNLKVAALVPLRSRVFLDALLDCGISLPVVKPDGEPKKQCGENVRKLTGKLVNVLDALQPAKFHWQWVEIRLLLNEQAINERIVESDMSFSDAVRSVVAPQSNASENESNFVQIVLSRLLSRPDAAPLFSQAVHWLGKSLQDSMLLQAIWLLRGPEVLYGKKSIRQKILNIASELKEPPSKPRYWKPWGWCRGGEKRKSEAASVLEEGEVVDEASGNGEANHSYYTIEGALVELILPCLDRGSDEMRNNFASEMIKQMTNIEHHINGITANPPAVAYPPGRSGSRKGGKSSSGSSPVVSRLPDSVPTSTAALRASMSLRLQFLLRLLPIVCGDR